MDPRSLDTEEKILSLLKILRGMRMTAMDLLLYTISEKPSMATWRDGFFRSNALAQLLNVLEVDERGTKQLNVVLRQRAIALVADEINTEMENAKFIFQMSSKDVTPELLLTFDLNRSLTEPLQETTPWLRQILMTAMCTA